MKAKPELYLHRVGTPNDWAEYLKGVEKKAREQMRPGSLQSVTDAIIDTLKARRQRWVLI